MRSVLPIQTDSRKQIEHNGKQSWWKAEQRLEKLRVEDWRLHGSTSKHQDKCNTGGATWILSVNTAKGSTAEFPSTKIVCTSQVVLLALGASIHSRYSNGINAVPVTCSLVAWRINVNGTGKRVTGGGKCCVEECGDALDTRSTNASHNKTWHVRSSTSPRVVQTKKASSSRRTTK